MPMPTTAGVPVQVSGSGILASYANPIFGEKCAPAQMPAANDYRVSVGSELRIVVPMLGPVPVSWSYGVPTLKTPESTMQFAHDAIATPVSYAPRIPSAVEARNDSRWSIRIHA